MSYTNSDRRYERHVTRTGRTTFYIGENGKKHYDHQPPPEENGWVVLIVGIAFLTFAIIYGAAQ